MKFVDYNSPEKAILKSIFNSISDMDMWICNIIEGYIYEKVDKKNKFGYREEYVLRYGKKEGEYKEWNEKGQIIEKSNYKDDKLEGEVKRYDEYGKLNLKFYYKDGKIQKQEYCRNGKLEEFESKIMFSSDFILYVKNTPIKKIK